MINCVTLSYFSFVKPVEHATVFRALQLLFPSGTAPPKKLGTCIEAFFHVLKVRLQHSMWIYCCILQSIMLSHILLSEDALNILKVQISDNVLMFQGEVKQLSEFQLDGDTYCPT
ncbi:hypothetical protein CRENBAI_003526 [Crenichthys baileyi]|uniref:Uncharacterized protein n=1 Tax=Crenichthys baileyi TaxID=28760 RepID=A0AAV9R5L9_9TELE